MILHILKEKTKTVCVCVCVCVYIYVDTGVYVYMAQKEWNGERSGMGEEGILKKTTFFTL